MGVRSLRLRTSSTYWPREGEHAFSLAATLPSESFLNRNRNNLQQESSLEVSATVLNTVRISLSTEATGTTSSLQ